MLFSNELEDKFSELTAKPTELYLLYVQFYK